MAQDPDRTYRLSASIRDELPSGIDAGALERLLQHYPEDYRASLFNSVVGKPDPPKANGTPGDISRLDRISDPVLQRLLEECWQPYWAVQPLAMLERLGGPPGREPALQRRRAEQKD